MLKRLYTFILFLQFTGLAMADPTDSLRIEKRDAQTYIIHRVVKNEGLAQLAKRYGVSESDILSHNPMVTEKVYDGQLLKIPLNQAKYGNLSAPEVKPLAASALPIATTLPSPEEEKTAPLNESSEDMPKPVATTMANKGSGRPIAMFNTYVVSSPQTVQQVANTFSVEASDIIKENDLQNYRLKAGQKIKIPVYADAKAKETSVQTVAAKEQVATKPQAPVVEAKPVVAQKPIEKPAEKPIEKKSVQPDTKPTVASAKPAVTEKKVEEVVIEDRGEKKVKPLPEVLAKKVKDEEPMLDTKVAPANKPDTLTEAYRKRRLALANIDYLDSNYIHPDGVSYRLLDYRQMDYQFDTRIMRIAEENAIEVPEVNQRNGYGNKNTVHIVKREESLQSIAQKYRVSATDIINWNGLLNYRVREGQELIINSERANMSPYQRTVVTQKPTAKEQVFIEQSIKGFAYYDAKKTFKGVYVNGVEKGKFITLQNRDTYEKTIARVIGPLPAGLPEGTIVLIDQVTAKELKVENEKIYIQIWINAVTEESEVAVQETK